MYEDLKSVLAKYPSNDRPRYIGLRKIECSPDGRWTLFLEIAVVDYDQNNREPHGPWTGLLQIRCVAPFDYQICAPSPGRLMGGPPIELEVDKYPPATFPVPGDDNRRRNERPLSELRLERSRVVAESFDVQRIGDARAAGITQVTFARPGAVA